MDADRFDRLARSLMAPSRRGFGRALAGLTLGGLLVPLLDPAAAEGKKKRRKKCKGGKRKCGKKCISQSDCCKDADCGEGERCCSGQCSVPVYCNEQPVCDACGEVCRAEGLEGECQAGGCPDFDYCNTSGSYYCGVCDVTGCCVCATSLEGTNGCVDVDGFEGLDCESDDECTEALGQPALCIPGGDDCSYAVPICAPRCRGGSAPRAAGRSGRF